MLKNITIILESGQYNKIVPKTYKQSEFLGAQQWQWKDL